MSRLPRLRHPDPAVVVDPTAEVAALAAVTAEVDPVAALEVAMEVALEVAASPIAFSKRSATSVRISQAPAPVPVEAVAVLP